MALLVYQQHYTNLKKFVALFKKGGATKASTTAAAVNALHESYLNPGTTEGTLNPGPPMTLRANTYSGGGLFQWTPWTQKIPGMLGTSEKNWQDQVNFFFKNSPAQWTGPAWFSYAGLANPTPKLGGNINDFVKNTYGYSDTQLAQAFIGYFEKPAYEYGRQRYNSAGADCAEVRKYVEQYWGSGGNDDPNHGSPGGDGTNVLSEATIKLIRSFLKIYEDALKKEVPIAQRTQFSFNNLVEIKKIFPNIENIKMTSQFAKMIEKAIEDAREDVPKPPNGNNDDNPDPGDNAKNKDIYNAILKWCGNNLGKTYDYDASHPGAGAQCVDLIKAISIYVLKHNLDTPLSSGNAQDIFSNDISKTKWKRVNGDTNNDDNAVKIWNGLPNGCIVFFKYRDFGHVAIKKGNAMIVYEQNYNLHHYITTENIYGWVHGYGAGFLGAWVLK